MLDYRVPRRLLLIFGTLIALGNLVGWTVADYRLRGELTTLGLERALFVWTSVLALYIVLRLALHVMHRDTV